MYPLIWKHSQTPRRHTTSLENTNANDRCANYIVRGSTINEKWSEVVVTFKFVAEIWSNSEHNVAPLQNLTGFSPFIMGRYGCWKKGASPNQVHILVPYFRY